VICDRLMVASSGYLHRLPRYNWNIVESGVKYHNPQLLKRTRGSPEPVFTHLIIICIKQLTSWTRIKNIPKINFTLTSNNCNFLYNIKPLLIISYVKILGLFHRKILYKRRLFYIFSLGSNVKLQCPWWTSHRNEYPWNIPAKFPSKWFSLFVEIFSEYGSVLNFVLQWQPFWISDPCEKCIFCNWPSNNHTSQIQIGLNQLYSFKKYNLLNLLHCINI
jgi:hypothetical protein